jgi:biotin operon repressor
MSGVARRSMAEINGERMPTQLEVVRQVMLLAAQYGSWMTLEELARKTKFPEAGISAQLRRLRKEGHGAFRVEKRRREWQEALRTNAKERVWEYQVRG